MINFCCSCHGENYDVIIFILKLLFLRRTGVVNFADIIKFPTIFIKAALKDLGNFLKIRNSTLKCNLFLDITKISDFSEKMLISVETKRCVT